MNVAMSDLESMLEQILSLGDVRGPLPAFSPVHMIYALMLIQDYGRIGRKRLSDLLSLGEGSVRTLIKKLDSLGLVTAGKSGYALSEKGSGLLRLLSSKITKLTELKIPLPWKSPHNTGIVVRGAASSVKSGIVQRDASIRFGAEEALILTYSEDGLQMPMISNLSRERPDFAAQIVDSLHPSKGDVIIITGARDSVASRYAALGAALTLLRH